MRKLRLRKGFWIILPAFMLAFFASPVRADTYTVTGAEDFYFEIQETSTFTVRTFAWQNGIDSMLWLYDSNEQLLVANDDYFGLDSHIEIILQPGQYRLRTGVCCWDPERWYGSSYSFETNITGYITSSTTVPETTTTQPEIPETTTTTVPETTTTIQETTTTTTETTIVPEIVTVPETTVPTVVTIPATTLPTPIITSPPQSAVTTTTQQTTTTTQAPQEVEDDIIDILNNIENINQVEIINFVNNIINNGLSNEEAILVASKPEILESITIDQAKEIFKSLEISNLSTEQEKELAESLSNAPESIKNEFENSIDIFGEGFDEYVPTGSSIDVGTRRAIIAVTAVATSITMTAPSTGASSSPSGASGTSTDRSSNRSRRN